MELKLLNFEYDFDEKKFCNMMYSLDSKLPLDEKIVSLGNSLFREIACIVDKVYLTLPNVQKTKKDRRIDSDGISWGFSYGLKDEDDIDHEFVDLIGRIGSLWGIEEPKEKFTLFNRDTDSKRVLNLYDLILNLPNLTFSSSVELQKKQINYIRNMKEFNLNDYLKIK